MHFSCTYAPINNWLLSCRWMCPSAGASCVAAGSSSSRSDASLTLRSARMRCHLLSFSGTPAFTWTSNGPLPTSKEKRTSVEAARRGKIQTYCTYSTTSHSFTACSLLPADDETLRAKYSKHKPLSHLFQGLIQLLKLFFLSFPNS